MRNAEEILANDKICNIIKNINNDKVIKLKLEAKLQSESSVALILITKISTPSIHGSWEHVSVSYPDKIPSWNTMQEVKEMVWLDTEDVYQYHPTKDNYVNNNEHTLHLWRPLHVSIPKPPSILVGFRPSHIMEDRHAAKILHEEIGSPLSDLELDLLVASCTNTPINNNKLNLDAMISIMKKLGGI